VTTTHDDPSLSAICKCGHPRSIHATLLSAPSRACMASVDKRHVSTGGSELHPCDCAGFAPIGIAEWPSISSQLVRNAS